ncbi:MAG: YfhO family protein, partial [Alistipes sp.]|nr:YfhO family protein [Alistipes sp.]
AAWFVERVAFAPNAEAEIDLLDEVDLRTTAVVAGKDADRIRTLHADISTAGISLEEYRPNYLRYRYTSPEEAVALFSEIFYDKGWTAYVDGEEWPYFRADYVLRGMELPAGEHQVEWRFRAPAWGVVNGIMLVASLVILLGAVTAVVYGVRRRSEA